MKSFNFSRWPTASRSVVATSCTASAGRPHSVRRVGEDAVQGGVGVLRFLAAAKDDGVAALDAQGRRIDGDVGPRLVDEEDDAERHADLVDFQAVGPNPALAHLADGIGQGGDFAQPVGSSLEARRGEAQPVDLGGTEAEARARRRRHVHWRRGFRRRDRSGQRRRWSQRSLAAPEMVARRRPASLARRARSVQ